MHQMRINSRFIILYINNKAFITQLNVSLFGFLLLGMGSLLSTLGSRPSINFWPGTEWRDVAVQQPMLSQSDSVHNRIPVPPPWRFMIFDSVWPQTAGQQN